MTFMPGYMIALESEAIQYIQGKAGEKNFVAFSGGKDSIVLLDLIRRSGVSFDAYYNFTSVDPPQLTRFIRKEYPSVNWLRPEMNFWDLCRKENRMPTRKARFCCDSLKHNSKAVRALNYTHTFIGVRAEESYRRRMRPRTEAKNKRPPIRYILKPIFNWAADEIWEYIHVNNLEYPSLYDEGFHRLGCVVCPFVTSPRLLDKHRRRWPAYYRILGRLLQEQWDKNEPAITALGFTKERFMSWPQWDL